MRRTTGNSIYESHGIFFIYFYSFFFQTLKPELNALCLSDSWCHCDIIRQRIFSTLHIKISLCFLNAAYHENEL